MTGTVSRTARAVAARRGRKEAVGKAPARGTRSAYEATVSGRERPKDPKPDSHPEGLGVDATGIWGEGGCAIPGEICLFVFDWAGANTRNRGVSAALHPTQ